MNSIMHILHESCGSTGTCPAHLLRAVGLVLAVGSTVAPRDAGAGLGLSGRTQVICEGGARGTGCVRRQCKNGWCHQATMPADARQAGWLACRLAHLHSSPHRNVISRSVPPLPPTPNSPQALASGDQGSSVRMTVTTGMSQMYSGV